MEIKLTYPASYLTHKNHDLLLENALKIYQEVPEIKIYLTIDKNIYGREFPNIIFMGHMDRNDVLKMIKSSDALLFLSSFESLGIPIIEATSFSLPIIAPKLNYCEELIGANAYYFELENNFYDSFVSVLKTVRKDIKNKNLIKSKLLPDIIKSEDLVSLFIKKLKKK